MFEARVVPSVSNVDITSIVATGDRDGNLTGGDEHVLITAGTAVNVSFSYTTAGGTASSNRHVEIWPSGFTGSNPLISTSDNVVTNEANGLHSGMISVNTTGLAPGNYGVKVLINHQGNGSTSDNNSVSIYAHATPTIPLTALNTTYNGFAYNGASVGSFAGDSFGTTNLSYSPGGSAPTNAGTYTVTASYVSDGQVHGFTQYDNTSVSKTFTIDRASSVTTTVGDGPFTYDGTTHAGGSGTVTGAGGLSTAATSLTYSGDQVDAGTYYVTAHYAGDANHTPSDGDPVAITINKANATISVTGYTDTWNNIAHTATGTATGVLGENLSALLNLGGTTHTGIGSYTDGWSFAGNGNYNAASGTVFDTITPPTASLFSSATQGAVNVGKNGSLSDTLTAVNPLADNDTLAALGALPASAFRLTFTNNLGSKVVTSVNRSYTAGSGLSVSISDVSVLSNLANPAVNTSSSTGVSTTMTLEVNIGGTWYTISTVTGIKFFSKG